MVDVMHVSEHMLRIAENIFQIIRMHQSKFYSNLLCLLEINSCEWLSFVQKQENNNVCEVIVFM